FPRKIHSRSNRKNSICQDYWLACHAFLRTALHMREGGYDVVVNLIFFGAYINNYLCRVRTITVEK
ncbi:hypothetical protein ACJX0J_019262, partial [Zea mays]